MFVLNSSMKTNNYHRKEIRMACLYKNNLLLSMNVINRINEKLENGFTKGLFDHIRNLLMCAFLLAIGTGQLKEQSDMLIGITQGKYSGAGVIAVAFILITINIYDGVRIIRKAKVNILLSISSILLYLFLTLKVFEMAWDFRVPY